MIWFVLVSVAAALRVATHGLKPQPPPRPPLSGPGYRPPS